MTDLEAMRLLMRLAAQPGFDRARFASHEAWAKYLVEAGQALAAAVRRENGEVD